MKFSTPSFKRIMLILSPCAALSSFDAQARANFNGTPDDYKAIKHSGKKSVVMLASDGCGHCRQASPHFEAIATDPANESIEFLKLKSSENGDVMNEENLDGVPAFLFIDENGAIKDKQTGFESEDKLRTMVRNHAAAPAEMTEAVVTEDVSANVETGAPVHQEGVLAKIQGLLMGLFNAIKHVFVSIFDWIKGLFNR